jgi:hypothetical protein
MSAVRLVRRQARTGQPILVTQLRMAVHELSFAATFSTQSAFASIEQRIDEWQLEYNWRRPHGLPGGTKPADRIAELNEVTPVSGATADAYDELKDRTRHRAPKIDKTRTDLHKRMLVLVGPAATSTNMPANRCPEN